MIKVVVERMRIIARRQGRGHRRVSYRSVLLPRLYLQQQQIVRRPRDLVCQIRMTWTQRRSLHLLTRANRL